jgi:sulfatase modifying factor 1
MMKSFVSTCLASLLACLAITQSLSASLINIDTVLVGDAGNPNDSTGYGAVNYEYRIGKYEVTIAQYTAFLNAVAATDTYALWHSPMESRNNIAGISRSGSIGSYSYSVIGSGNRPVTFVDWFDAARFANWMANGQPTGAQGNATTENGAYSLFGATTGVGFTKNAINPNTLTTTTWWLPSENEWYKAAYYDPSPSGPSDDYWRYATRSDSAPGNMIGAVANQANYYLFNGSESIYSVTQSSGINSSLNYLTNVGAFSNSGSYYGTYDQNGNVSEWNDAIIGSYRGVRGGSWSTSDGYDSGVGVFLQSTDRGSKSPGAAYFSGDSNLGFRVASIPEISAVPEPGQVAASGVLLVGGGLYWLVRRRKVTL